MSDSPPLSVLNALGVSDTGRKIEGGQGLALQFGNLVLKPCENPAEWEGLSPLLMSLSQIGYRIARPVLFPDGKWVVDDWLATEMIEGIPGFSGREQEALDACDSMHGDIKRIYGSATRPDWLRNDSIYARADSIAWGEVSSAEYLDASTRQPIDNLLKYIKPLNSPEPQVTHGDPGGDNILFSDHAPPGIIDFSPCWRPSGYAIAMMLADGIAWEGSSPGTLNLVADRTDIDQLLLRAVIFRLVVSVLFSGPNRLSRQIKAYSPVVQWVIENRYI